MQKKSKHPNHLKLPYLSNTTTKTETQTQLQKHTTKHPQSPTEDTKTTIHTDTLKR